MGVILNHFFYDAYKLSSSHLVSLPVLNSISEIGSVINLPDFNYFLEFKIWKLGFVIAIIASIETLLCVEATDKLDPEKRICPTNRELISQGIGNIFSGLLGGLPVTQVIVRSSANIISGGKTKISVIAHGVFMLISVLFFAKFLNFIPLSSLAAILIMVGYKLAKPTLFKSMYKEGLDQFIPFLVTIIAIVFTDLLKGIMLGLCVGLIYVLLTNFRSAVYVKYEGNLMLMKFKKDIFFFNKANIMENLVKLKSGDQLFLDATQAQFIDHDVYLTIKEFKAEAVHKNIKVELTEMQRGKIKN